jgi:hypothetical protein
VIVHVGELDTQVEVQGVGPSSAPGAAAAKPKAWDERQRYRELCEELAAVRARTAGGGFDG